LSPGGLWCGARCAPAPAALGLRRAPTRGAPTSSSMSATSALQPPASSLQSPASSISLLMAGCRLTLPSGSRERAGAPRTAAIPSRVVRCTDQLAAHYDLLALEGECRRPSAPA